MENEDWVKDRVAYLKGVKARTEQQELLVLLADNPSKSAQDSKKLSALVKAEKAAVRAQQGTPGSGDLAQRGKTGCKRGTAQGPQSPADPAGGENMACCC